MDVAGFDGLVYVGEFLLRSVTLPLWLYVFNFVVCYNCWLVLVLHGWFWHTALTLGLWF